MSNTPSAVYHCPSCGALAKADPDTGDVSVCTECGHEFRRPIRVAPRHSGPKAEGLGKFVQRDVVSRRRLVERDQSVVLAELPPPVEADKIVSERGERPGEEVVSDDGRKKVIRRRKRKRRMNKRPYVFGMLWLLLVTAVFLNMRGRFKSKLSTGDNFQSKEQLAEKAEAAEVAIYIQTHFRECRQVLGQFLDAPDTAGRAQFVYDPLRVTPLMDRYTGERGTPKLQGALKAVTQGLIIRDSFRAIETLWEAPDEEDYEVTFIRSEGTWRIDWEAFTVYSTTPWQFFVVGAGPSSGEFRLFVRETSRSDSETIEVRFYPPVYDATLRHRRQSEPIGVPALSVVGKRLRAVLDQKDQKPGWGDSSIAQRDPVGYFRARVVLEWRTAASGGAELYIKEVKAGNWLGAGLDEEIVVEEEEEEPQEG